MRMLLSILLTLIFLDVYPQDTLKLKQIDELVSAINTSTLPVQRDTIKQDRPEIGLKMTTYLAMIANDNELIKYENNVNATVNENGTIRQTTASNTFYYYHNKLIKVEEHLIEGDKKGDVDWYYSNDKPLFYTLKTEKAEERANFLLTLSKTLQKQIIK